MGQGEGLEGVCWSVLEKMWEQLERAYIVGLRDLRRCRQGEEETEDNAMEQEFTFFHTVFKIQLF